MKNWVIRKLFLIGLVLFFLARAAYGQTSTVQIFRAFNPNVDTCSDSAATVIVQTNPAFGSGKWYFCLIGAYSPLDITQASNAVSLGNGDYTFGTSFPSLTTGANNVGIGSQALFAITSGNHNNALGANSQIHTTTGTDNASIGVFSLTSNTTGSFNTAIGNSALRANTTANTNTAVGFDSSSSITTGQGNTALGEGTLHANVSSDDNVAIGLECLFNSTSASNVCIGAVSLFALTTGQANVVIGTAALDQLTTGNENVSLGNQSGRNSGTPFVTGDDNVFLGFNANSSASGVNNSTALGANSQVTKSNQIVLGNNSVTEVLTHGNVIATTAQVNTSLGVGGVNDGSGEPLHVMLAGSSTAPSIVTRNENTTTSTANGSGTCTEYVNKTASGTRSISGWNCFNFSNNNDGVRATDFVSYARAVASGNPVEVLRVTGLDQTLLLNQNRIYSGGTPAIAGNGTLNVNSKDSAGKVTATATAASTIVLTFSTAFTHAPACSVNNETTAVLARGISTTTTLTVAGALVTGDVLSYHCLGY